MVEVLIEDFGYDELAKPVVKPLDGVKFAGYVGCQTNRPFGIAGESFENPMYLDKLVETVGGEAAAEYEQKVTCCGGALAFSEPEKSQKQIKDIVESAYDHGADMIVTPCPLCQANVEVYQSEINRRQGTKLDMPVTYYSQLMTVAYGGTAKEAGSTATSSRRRSCRRSPSASRRSSRHAGTMPRVPTAVSRRCSMERRAYKPLPMRECGEGVVVPATGCRVPSRSELDSPAVEVMTDLRAVAAADDPRQRDASPRPTG